MPKSSFYGDVLSEAESTQIPIHSFRPIQEILLLQCAHDS